MKTEEIRYKLIEILNKASEITVLAEPDEPGALDKLFAVFDEFGALLEGSGYETLSGYLKALKGFLDKAAEGDEDASVAFKVCVEAIVAFQGIVRDERGIEEVAFPVELGHGILSGEPPGVDLVDEAQGGVISGGAPGGLALPKANSGKMAGLRTEPSVSRMTQPSDETPVAEMSGADERLKCRDDSGTPDKNEERSGYLDMTTGSAVLERVAQAEGGLTIEERAGKYLTFCLGDEEYGLEILKVQEIIKMMEITRVPRTPEFVRGVINLRGKVIPVVDLRTKFGMPVVDVTEKTCVIVVQVARETGHVTMGIIVDEVSEVLDISAECMEPTPEFGTSVDTAFILGMGKLDKKVVMLLDVDKVLSSGELESLSAC